MCLNFLIIRVIVFCSGLECPLNSFDNALERANGVFLFFSLNYFIMKLSLGIEYLDIMYEPTCKDVNKTNVYTQK